MKYKKIEINGYILGLAKVENNGNISKDEYDRITEIIHNKPSADNGYDYRLKVIGVNNYEWERYEVPVVEEPETAYTAEQLNGMSVAELEAVCAELGISPNKNKANMVVLILNKQEERND